MSSGGSGDPYRAPPGEACTHGVDFPPDDEYAEATKGLSVAEIRKRWPRHSGVCSLCGYNGIYYASYLHYLAGDW